MQCVASSHLLVRKPGPFRDKKGPWAGHRESLRVLLAVCCFELCALGQTTYQWTSVDNNQFWSDPANWSPTGVPGQTCTNCSVSVPYPSGAYPIQNVSSLTLSNLTIAAGERADMVDGDTMTLNGTALSGYLVMNNSGGATTTLNITGSLNFSAAAGYALTMQNNSSILGNGTLSNNGTISYGGSGLKQGNIGDGSLTLENNFGSTVISGGMGGSSSILNLCPNKNWTNAGNLVAQNGAELNIECNGTITQTSAGQISAANAQVTLGGTAGNPTIVGGTLATPNGGRIYAGNGGSPTTLSNLTNNGTYSTNSTNGTSLVGTIQNNGIIYAASSPGLLINSPVILSGAGSVYVSGHPNGLISGSSTLTNNQLIQGSGTIQVATLTNQGKIEAVSSSSPLTIMPGSGGFSNPGTITAVSGGTAVISGGTINNSGLISAGAGSMQLTGGVTVVGGGVGDNMGGFVEGVSAILDGTTPITIGGPFFVNFGDQTELKGTFRGTGNIEVSGCPTPAQLQTKGIVVLDVSVTLGNDCSQNSFTGDGSTVTLGPGYTLTSTGGDISNMKLSVDGILDAIATTTTVDSTASLSVGPKATVNINPSVTLDVSNLLNFKANTLTNGIYTVNGSLIFGNANVYTNKANVTVTYPGTITDQSNNNAFRAFTTNKGHFFLGPNAFQDVTPQTMPFSNQGSLGVGGSGYFTINGGGVPRGASERNSAVGKRLLPESPTIAYNQTGSTAVTLVDGELTVPSGDVIAISGGTAEGAGTYNGSVQVGNPTGGAVATFIVGDSTKKAASVTVTNAYTQLATGVMDVQIGGTNPGSQYSQLSVTGAVNLSGTLNIRLINKFKPSVGQTYTILNAPSGITGTFTTVNGLSINSNEHFAIAYNSTSIVLTVESGP